MKNLLLCILDIQYSFSLFFGTNSQSSIWEDVENVIIDII